VIRVAILMWCGNWITLFSSDLMETTRFRSFLRHFSVLMK
jgi:hypothetical protein